MFAEIVLPIALEKGFHYRIPKALQDKVVPGSVVTVPFGQQQKTGYCVRLTAQTDLPPARLKEIASVNDDIPPIDEQMLKLTRWLADYYLCSWGEAIEATLPAGVRGGAGLKRAVRAVDKYLTAPVTKTAPFTPNPDQARAIAAIKAATESRQRGGGFLLHGITGSGKTEVYLQVIQEVINQGKQAIVLVPEVALTPQTVQRFRERFDRVAVLHSYLTPAQRAQQWRRIRSGEIDVVIGARSAIFAPTRDLGIIVIDEEYETSFKQESTPCYHTRTVALKRAEIEQAVVVLGSATPSLEVYYLAHNGVLQYLELPERIAGRPLPEVEIVDMTLQRKSKEGAGIISPPLEKAIRQAHEQKEQTILLLNRRGYLTLVTCPRCKFILRCDRCRIALTYHKQDNQLVCHHCERKSDLPATCPECGYPKLARVGSGTERVEETVRNLIGHTDSLIQVNRLDSDVLKKKSAGRTALDNLWGGTADILVGTQLVAKGLDFPNVTLVGIISTDTALYLKDFRSAERTFQLLTQVAGRTGRGDKGGRVIAQTVNPQHYSIIHGARHDYHAFAREELAFREAFGYPPYRHLWRILVSGRKEEQVKQYCQEIADRLKSFIAKNSVRTDAHPGGEGMELLGPAPCPWSRIRNLYRWQMIVKSPTPELIQKLYRDYKTALTPKTRALRVTLDVDPLNLL